MSDGKVIIDTILDSSQFEKGLSKLAGAAKSGGGIAAKAIAAAGTALTAAGGYAVKVGADFDEGMSKVSAISGATGKDLEALRNKAKEMGATTKFSATESAEALQYMAMAGWDTEQMISGLPGVMHLAAASGEDLASVSDIVTDALTAFGLKASDSAHFADVLAKAASSSNTNVGLMGNTFQYVAPIAGAMKYSIEDTAVAIGLMANAGIKGEKAGTALRSMMTRLVKPTDATAAAMENLGVNVKKSDGSMKPLNTVLRDLRKGFAGLTDSEKAEYAANIAGQEAMSGLLAIVNAGDDDFENLTAQINNADGAASAMADTMNDNLKGQVVILQSALEGLGIEIYESVDAPLKNVAITAQGSVNEMTNAFKKGGFSGLAKKAGSIIADAVTQIAKAAPKVIAVGADTIKAFLQGIKNNLPQLKTAAFDIVKALAGGIADLLPKELGNACKNLVSVAISVAKPLLAIAEAAVKVADKLSGLAVAFGALAIVLKVNSYLNHFSQAMQLVKVGQEANTASTVANTIATKLNAIEMKAASAASVYKAAVDKSLAASTVACTGATTTYTIAQRASAVASGVAAVAQKAWNVAVAAFGGPVGVAVAALGLLVGAILAFTNSSDGFNDALEKEREKTDALTRAQKDCEQSVRDNQKARSEAMKDAEVEAGTLDFLYKKLEELNGIEDKSAAQKAQLKAVVEDLNEVVPELGLAYDDETDSLNKSTQEVRKAIDAQKDLIMAKAAQEKMLEVAKERIQVEMDLDKAMEQSADTHKKLQQAQEDLANTHGRDRGLQKEVRELTELYGEQEQAVDGYKKTLRGLDGEYDNLSQTYTKFMTSDDIDKTLADLCEGAKLKAEDIPKAVSDGIKTGAYQVPQSIEELNALIDYNDLVKKANDAGITIPDRIASGALAGGEHLSTAVSQLSGLVDFHEMVDKAKAGGTNVSKNLIAGVEAGSLPLPTTMAELNALIEFDDALADADLAGDKIPQFLVDGFKNGNLSVEQATTQLGSYINFEKDLKRANKIGAQIPADLAKQVKSGKVSVGEAQDILNREIQKKQDKLPGQAQSAGSKSSKSLKTGIASGKLQAANAAKSVVDAAHGKMKSKDFKPVGKGITDGTRRGMNASSVISAAADFASRALAAAKKVLGIKSPSRRFRDEVGAMAVKGCALGIEDEGDSVSHAVEEVMDDAVNAADTSALAKKLNLAPAEIDAMYDRAQSAVLLQTSKVPAPVQEFIAKNVPYADEDMQDTGGDVYEIHIHSHIGAREVAEETAVYNDAQLGKRNKRKERGNAG